jgi:hypothetical protein
MKEKNNRAMANCEKYAIIKVEKNFASKEV